MTNPTPQGQPYITLQELKTFGLSAQFLNSPLLTQESITDAWAASTGFQANALVQPLVDNGYAYQALSSGISGGTAPSWPVGQGQTVIDGGVTWVCIGPNTVANIAIMAASEQCDFYLRSKVGLNMPLKTWGFDLKQVCAWIAAYNIANVRGYSPAIAAEDTFRIRYQDALKLLRDFANGIGTFDIQNQVMNPPGAADMQLQPTTSSPSTTGSPPVWQYGTRGSWAR